MKRDPTVVSRTMSAVKSRNTKPELALGSAMWSAGLRYRKQYKIFGSPDFVFVKKKIAIFCDGDFWHGNNWQIRGLASLEEELGGYSDYWKAKIRRNIQRDEAVNERLKREGWTVVRIWASEIRRDLPGCVRHILQIVNSTSRV